VQLTEMSWPRAGEALRNGLAIVPIGSTEQHGLHLPLGTDMYLAAEVARRVGEKCKVAVLPVIPIGVSHHHMAFPGTVSLRSSTLFQVLQDIVDSLYRHGVRVIVFINGHGGNTPVVRTLLQELSARKDLCACLIDWFQLAGHLFGYDGHAGNLETSPMLAVKGQLVDMSFARPTELGRGKFAGRLAPKRFGVIALDGGWEFSATMAFEECTSTGSYGDPSVATAEMGERMLRAVVEYVAQVVEELKKVQLQTAPHAEKHLEG